jgi:hypothetical protein
MNKTKFEFTIPDQFFYGDETLKTNYSICEDRFTCECDQEFKDVHCECKADNFTKDDLCHAILDIIQIQLQFKK